jgi:hypothetical protein
MLFKSAVLAGGLMLSAATAASAQAVVVEPGPFYGPPFFGPPVYAVPAPVIVAPPAYYAAPGPFPGPYYRRGFYDAGVVVAPGWGPRW